MKVIFHLMDQERFNFLYANVMNILSEDIDEVRVLINASAVNLVTTDKVKNILALIEQGVVVSCCENALRAYNIDKSQVDKKINLVATGVYELVLRQQEGYAYIKV